MKIKSVAKLFIGALVLGSHMGLAVAGDKDGGISAAAIDQLALANQLISLGDQRNDPLLLIAGAKLQKTLSAEPLKLSDKSFKTADVLARAKEMAGDRADLTGLADDVSAMGTKGTKIYNYSNGYYTGTTYR